MAEESKDDDESGPAGAATKRSITWANSAGKNLTRTHEYYPGPGYKVPAPPGTIGRYIQENSNYGKKLLALPPTNERREAFRERIRSLPQHANTQIAVNISLPADKSIILRTSITVDDYYPELVPFQNEFKEISRPILTAFGHEYLSTVIFRFSTPFSVIYTDGTPAAQDTAKAIFPDQTPQLFDSTSSSTVGRFLLIGSSAFLNSAVFGIPQRTSLPPLSFITMPIGSKSVDLPLEIRPLWPESLPKLNKSEDIFFPSQPLPLYETIPQTAVKGILKLKTINNINSLYKAFLQALSVPVETPIATIISALHNASINVEAALTFIQNRYPILDTPTKRETLYAQFCKVYACHTKLPFTQYWPPPNYSDSAPPLYSIEGYTNETTMESDIRVLSLLYERAKESYPSLFSFLTALRDTPTTQTNIERLNSLLRAPITLENINDLYRHEEVDAISLKVLVRAQGAERLLEGILSLTPLDFFLKEANSSNYSESTGIAFNIVPLGLIALTNTPADRNQMFIAFFPDCGKSSPEMDFDKSGITGITLSSMSWVEFNYNFPSSNPMIGLCNAYNNIRDPDIGKEFQQIGVIQGFRTELFPHPDFLIAMSKGIRRAHPRMRTLWPEWFDPAERTRWLERVLNGWEMDIRAMPATTLYERVLKEVQQSFFLYAKHHIYPEVSREPGAAEALQLQTAPQESGIPAMLSRVNMNANKNANAAYQRFNRNVRPFLRGPAAATVKARRRGFFTGESKNSYRRTLKGQLYKLMREAGAEFTEEDAKAELRYIHDLAENATIPDRVVAERMKDWAQRYVAEMQSNYRIKVRAEKPDVLARLDQVASLFTPLNPAATRRATLQELAMEAVRMANPGALPSRAESMEAAVRRVVFSPKVIRGKALYDEIQRILTTYKDVVEENPAVGAAAAAIQSPPQRGFFARTFGGRNTAYEDRLQSAAQTLLRILSAKEQPYTVQKTPFGRACDASIKKDPRCSQRLALLEIVKPNEKPLKYNYSSFIPVKLDENYKIIKILKKYSKNINFLDDIIADIKITPEQYKLLEKTVPDDSPIVEHWIEEGVPNGRKVKVSRSNYGQFITYDEETGSPNFKPSNTIRYVPKENIESLLNDMSQTTTTYLQDKYPITQQYKLAPNPRYTISSPTLPPTVLPVANAGKMLPSGLPTTTAVSAGVNGPKLTTQTYEIIEPPGPAAAGAAAKPAPPPYILVSYLEGKPTSITEITPPPGSNIDPASILPMTKDEYYKLQANIGRHQGGGRRKTTRHTRMGRRRNRTRRQRGGAATSMPLAWYQPGAQFQGTVADPTGVGLAGASAAWARSALPAQGGGRRQRRQTRRRQQGGFSPSIMGAGFAEVGMRLLPAAAYMGYNQLQTYNKSRWTHRRSRK